MSYRSSQARDQTRATTTTWATGVTLPSLTCWATRELQKFEHFNQTTLGDSGFSVVFCFCFCFCFLGLHPQHMEVPRLGVESELQLLAYATATAKSQQRWIQATYTTAHDNARSLNHWARPGIESMSLCCTFFSVHLLCILYSRYVIYHMFVFLFWTYFT